MRNDRNTVTADSVVGVAVRRRHRSKQERRRIAEESLQPGASVAVVARRHGVNANQVFHWRKLLREGRLDEGPPAAQLLPVMISSSVEEPVRPVRCYSGSIQIELGRARVRIDGAADPESLHLVLEHLGR
jgi:transposase